RPLRWGRSPRALNTPIMWSPNLRVRTVRAPGWSCDRAVSAHSSSETTLIGNGQLDDVHWRIGFKRRDQDFVPSIEIRCSGVARAVNTAGPLPACSAMGAISKLEILLEKAVDVFDRVGACGGVVAQAGAVTHAGFQIGADAVGGHCRIVHVIHAQGVAIREIDHQIALRSHLEGLYESLELALDVEIVKGLGIGDEGDRVALAFRPVGK